MMRLIQAFSLLVCFSLNGLAKDLGSYGVTFDIKEEDAIEMMKRKMVEKEKNGDISIRNQIIKERLKSKAVRPTPSFGITKATRTREFFYNPSISFNRDLRGKDNKIFYKAGTKVNPLHHMDFNEKWLFLDGDDEKQVDWALATSGNKVLILTNGSPAELMKKHKVRFFFDQNSMFTRKFGINHVPAILEKAGEVLKIKELGEF